MGSREASLGTYSQLVIYGPRQPFMLCGHFQPPTRSQRLQDSSFLASLSPLLNTFRWSWDTSSPNMERKLLPGSLSLLEVWGWA